MECQCFKNQESAASRYPATFLLFCLSSASGMRIICLSTSASLNRSCWQLCSASLRCESDWLHYGLGSSGRPSTSLTCTQLICGVGMNSTRLQ